MEIDKTEEPSSSLKQMMEVNGGIFAFIIGNFFVLALFSLVGIILMAAF